MTVWKHMKVGLGEITPQGICASSETELQSYGITFRKALYIRNAAYKIMFQSTPVNGGNRTEEGTHLPCLIIPLKGEVSNQSKVSDE
jgi:hypothetical protein